MYRYTPRFRTPHKTVGGFLPGIPVLSTNKADHHITEIVVKVVLNSNIPNYVKFQKSFQNCDIFNKTFNKLSIIYRSKQEGPSWS